MLLSRLSKLTPGETVGIPHAQHRREYNHQLARELACMRTWMTKKRETLGDLFCAPVQKSLPKYPNIEVLTNRPTSCIPSRGTTSLQRIIRLPQKNTPLQTETMPINSDLQTKTVHTNLSSLQRIKRLPQKKPRLPTKRTLISSSLPTKTTSGA
jgi:hypothetical protein